MSHDLLCHWFGLTAGDWPPDHYRLLGLERGEEDTGLIEKRVHEKLDEVRRYQCLHPGPATEAMNRLAQAFGCLTDDAQKRIYDEIVLGLKPKPAPAAPAQLGGETSPRPRVEIGVETSPRPASELGGETSPKPRGELGGETSPRPPITPPPVPPVPPLPPRRDPHAWLYTPNMPGPGDPTPPPMPRLPAAAETMIMPQLVIEEEDTRPWEPPPQVVIPEAPPKDLVAESARRSDAATRGLSTRRALYHRIAKTRHLLRLWHQLGDLLQDPELRLARTQAAELYRLVTKAEEAMNDFPLMGEAGQPGYLIVTLLRLTKSTALMSLSPSQRESLARDWKAGLTFLESHKAYLREEVRKHRKRGLFARWRRAWHALLNEQPLAVAAVLAGIAALSIAVIRALP
jgi:hypothetical protein